MSKTSLLKLGNARELKRNLSLILDQAALDLIEREIERHVTGLFTLGLNHYRHALRQQPASWRHKTSRLYYAAYSVGKAVRLYTSGEYTTDVKDHGRFGRLPDTFPGKSRYSNQLSLLREDRNTADYNHDARAKDLVINTADAEDLVRGFLKDSKMYLAGKGLRIRGRV